MSCTILLVTLQLSLKTCMHRSEREFIGKLTSECIRFLWPAHFSLGASGAWRNLLLSSNFVELAVHTGSRNRSRVRGSW